MSDNDQLGSLRVLAIVPARGGSKGIPRKNIRMLAGKPLLAWTAQAALGASKLARTILSTDDEEIALVGRSVGLDVPFMRPHELARDDTPTLPVLQHAIRELAEQGERYDAVCLLQPTHPYRTAAQIDACISLLESSRTDAVVSMLEVPHHYNPHWVYLPDPDGFMRLSTGESAPIARRQLLPKAYHRDGSIYVTRTKTIEAGSLYGDHLVGHVVSGNESVNLDNLEDWARAERVAVALGLG
jgi:CMP-N,N'-diacetyllegionaminic acid synthase